MSKGSSSSKTSSTPMQTPEYRALLDAATQQAGLGFYDPLYAGGAETLAGQTDAQLRMQERIAGEGGLGDIALSGLEQQLGAYDPNNPQLTAAIDMAAGDVTRNLQESLLPSIGSEAIGAGQFGSTRHGVAQGIALRGATEEVGDVATRMRLADMQQSQQGRADALTNLGQISAGLEQSVSGEQRAAQAGLDELFARWEYESGVPLQELSAYKGLISGDMGGKGRAPKQGGK